MTPHRLIVWILLALTLATAIVGWLRRSNFDTVRWWALAWVTFTAVSSIGEQVCRIVLKNTQYAAMIWFHGSGALAICVLAATVPDSAWRRRYYWAALIYPVVLLGITVFYETWGKPARLIGVIHGLTVLVVGCGILLVRTSIARVDLLRDPGFWIGAALMVQGAPTTFGTISSALYGHGSKPFVGMLYLMRNVAAIVGFAMLLRAFLLTPTRRLESVAPTPR